MIDYYIQPDEGQYEWLSISRAYLTWITFNWETFNCGLNQKCWVLVASDDPINITFPPLPACRKPLYRSLASEGTPEADEPIDPAHLDIIRMLHTGGSTVWLQWYGKVPRDFPADYYRQAWRLPCSFREEQVPIHPIWDRPFTAEEWAAIGENTLADYLDSLRPGPDSGSWRFDKDRWTTVPTGPAGERERTIDISQYKPVGEPAARPAWADKVRR